MSKQYEEALPLFIRLDDLAETPSNKLSGKIGAMRCAMELKNYESGLDYAIRTLNTDKITPQQFNEAKNYKAKSLFELQRYDDAMIEFKTIYKNAKNITGAEAQYHIAKIFFIKKDYDQVEKSINNLMSYNYSNSDWNTKGLLLMADCYVAKGADADAELMLQTIIDAKQEYVDEATEKLKEIKDRKNAILNAERNSEGLKVEFKSENKDADLFDQLFDANQEKIKNEEPKIETKKDN
jgi:hypothetical protein